MSDIDEMVAWLNGVLDEDELVARDAGGRNWGREDYGCVVDAADNGLIVYGEGTPSREQADHIARHDPAHVFNVVAAHRAILAEHVPWHFDGNTNPPDRILCFICSGPNRYGEQCGRTYPCSTLRSLALAYAGRDGYRAEWAPQ